METSKTVVMHEGSMDEYKMDISIPKRPWSVEPHSDIAKSFRILDAHGHEVFEVDYDDVNPAEQDFLAEWVVELVNRNS